MLSFFLLVAMSQTNHDAAERAMQSELRADKEQISDIWHPSKQLMSDYQAADKCYTKFHLGKTGSCAKELNRVRLDLLFRTPEAE